jgi:hypothetical protein
VAAHCDRKDSDGRSHPCQMEKSTAMKFHGGPLLMLVSGSTRRRCAERGLMPPAKQIKIYFQSTCRPAAQTLPLIGRTTAGPAGSSVITLLIRLSV